MGPGWSGDVSQQQSQRTAVVPQCPFYNEDTHVLRTYPLGSEWPAGSRRQSPGLPPSGVLSL